MTVGLDQTLVWDNVWPLEPWCGNDFDQLKQLKQAGWDVVSLTVAGDNHGSKEALEHVAKARATIASRSDLVLADTVAAVDAARAQDRLAVTLHFEGTRPFERSIELIAAFRRLGVTHGLLAFNNSNDAAGGCMETHDAGLTSWGRRVVTEMQRVGMLVDLSHTGRRSTLDALELATRPMTISHSNADAVTPHPRNVTDEQILACARSGGVVGLSASSEYLGERSASVEAMFRHVDHIASLAGDDCIALGLDIVFDAAAVTAWARTRPDEWPMTRDPAWPGFVYAPPSQLALLIQHMADRGYSDTSLRKFLGGNLQRLAQNAW